MGSKVSYPYSLQLGPFSNELRVTKPPIGGLTLRGEQRQQSDQQAELHPGAFCGRPGRPALIDPAPPEGRIPHPDNDHSL